MNIKERYKPYNFSATKCYVIELPFERANSLGFYGIEQTLPQYIGRLKGVYVTCRSNSLNKVIGGVLLSFNDVNLKNLQMPIHHADQIRDHSHPIPFDEEIRTNSLMQGFFIIRIGGGDGGVSGYIKIYLHYEPRK